MTHPNTTWSPEGDVLLRTEWAAGKSAAEISRMLGNRSRNAVIGRVHRLGLTSRARPSVPKPDPKPKALPKPKPEPKAKAEPKPHSKPYLVPETAEARDKRSAEMTDQGKSLVARMSAEPVNDNALRLMDRTFNQCAWPVGEPIRPAEQMCCGARVINDEDGKRLSYCQTHHDRVSNGKPVVKGVGREYSRPGERRRVSSVWDGGRAA